eukprot:2381757-Amphidinium_carterae.1
MDNFVQRHCSRGAATTVPLLLRGSDVSVPDGTPCWFESDVRGERNGMCYGGQCVPAQVLAEVPLCGNGGIDFGEEQRAVHSQQVESLFEDQIIQLGDKARMGYSRCVTSAYLAQFHVLEVVKLRTGYSSSIMAYKAPDVLVAR